MSSNSTPIDPQTLLDQMSFLRRLSRGLVQDQTQADDLTQDALVKALERPPEKPGSLRSWFRAVVTGTTKEAWRTDRRREKREQLVAPSEGLPSTVQVVERQELLANLFTAVRDLPEPYRSTVHHRFLEELPPREIARRQNLPVETVKWRLKKGLEQLRVTLDQKYEKDRQAWLAGLVVFAGVPEKASLTTLSILSSGGFLMALKSKILLLSTVAIILGGITLLLLPPGKKADLGWSEQTSQQPREVKATPTPTQSRKPHPGAKPPAQPVNTEEEKKVFQVTGEVIDPDGNPVPAVAVVCTPIGPEPDGEITGKRWQTGNDGRFVAQVLHAAGQVHVQDKAYATVLKGMFGLVDGAVRENPLVVVGPRVRVTGRVVNKAGKPLPDAHIQYTIPEKFGLSLDRSLDCTGNNPFDREKVDKQGCFTLNNLAAVPGAALQFRCTGYLSETMTIETGNRTGIEIVLKQPAPEPGSIYGQVLDHLGCPVAQARLCLGSAAAKTDSKGRFSLALARARDKRRINAIKRGFLPTNYDLSADELARGKAGGLFINLQFPGKPLEITGKVVDQDDNPLAGIKVWATKPTLFPNFDRNKIAMEGYLAGGLTRADFMGRFVKNGRPTITLDQMRVDYPNSRWGWVVTDGQGNFVLPGLLARDYRLGALAQDSLTRGESDLIRAGTKGVMIRLNLDKMAPKIGGMVKSIKGKPMGGLRVRALCEVIKLTTKTSSSPFYTIGPATTTAPDGSFTLPKISPTDCYLEITGKGIVAQFIGKNTPGSLQAAYPGSLTNIQVTVYRRVQFQLSLQDQTQADGLGAMDGDGKELFMTQHTSRGRRSSNRYPISRGKTGLASISEAVTEFILYKGEKEVGRIPVTLLPGEVNELTH